MLALVVERRAARRDLLGGVLEERGHQPVLADSLSAAIASYGAQRHPLVFIGIDSARWGTELLEALGPLRLPGESFVAVLATSLTADEADHLLLAGADDCLTTPITQRLLHARLAVAEAVLAARGQSPHQRNEYGEKKLGEANAGLRDICDQMADGLLVVDRNTHEVVGSNPAMRRLLGYDEAELRSRRAADVVVAGDRNNPLLFVHNLPGQAPVARPVQCLRKDGTVIEVEVACSPVNFGGRPCVVGFFREIGPLRRAFDRLASREARFRAIFEEAPVGIVLTDTEARIMEANAAMSRLLAEPPARLVGRSLIDFSDPAEVENERRTFRELKDGRHKTVCLEKRFLRGDGSVVWGRITSSMIAGDSTRPPLVLGVVEDISRRKQTEVELEHEQELLRQVLELHERDRSLLAAELHEGFAQQLTAAAMNIEAAALLCLSAPELARTELLHGMRLLQKSIKESRRLVSGLRPPVLDEFGLVAAIENLVADHSRNGTVEIDFDLRGVAARIAQPLENALFRIAQESLANACKHSRSPRIRLEMHFLPDRVGMVVQDWGSGFDPSQVAGTCFGLKGICERSRLLGGSAQVDSAPNAGTRISVWLPVLPASPDQ